MKTPMLFGDAKAFLSEIVKVAAQQPVHAWRFASPTNTFLLPSATSPLRRAFYFSVANLMLSWLKLVCLEVACRK